MFTCASIAVVLISVTARANRRRQLVCPPPPRSLFRRTRPTTNPRSILTFSLGERRTLNAQKRCDIQESETAAPADVAGGAADGAKPAGLDDPVRSLASTAKI